MRAKALDELCPAPRISVFNISAVATHNIHVAAISKIRDVNANINSTQRLAFHSANRQNININSPAVRKDRTCDRMRPMRSIKTMAIVVPINSARLVIKIAPKSNCVSDVSLFREEKTRVVTMRVPKYPKENVNQAPQSRNVIPIHCG